MYLCTFWKTLQSFWANNKGIVLFEDASSVDYVYSLVLPFGARLNTTSLKMQLLLRGVKAAYACLVPRPFIFNLSYKCKSHITCCIAVKLALRMLYIYVHLIVLFDCSGLLASVRIGNN